MAKTKTKKRTRRTSSKKQLSRTAIFASSANAVRRVETPELSVAAIYVRSLRASEFSSMQGVLLNDGRVKEAEVMARLVTLAACDANGERLFRDNDWESVNALPLPPVMRLFHAALKLNNISDEDIAEMVKQ